MTPTGVLLVKAFESLRLVGYLCPAGKPTCGYGATSATGRAITVGMTIDRATAEKWLAEDLLAYERKVLAALQASAAKLTPSQLDACVSIAYNIGAEAFAKSTLARKIRAGDLDAVPAQFMRWNKVDGVASKGLTRRRRAECALWRGDLEDAERYAGVDFGPMPQKVDPPKPAKSILASKTGNASIISGVAGGGSLLAGALDKADQAVGLAETSRGLFDRVVALPAFWIALLVIGCAAFIWFDRRRKLEEGA